MDVDRVASRAVAREHNICRAKQQERTWSHEARRFARCSAMHTFKINGRIRIHFSQSQLSLLGSVVLRLGL